MNAWTMLVAVASGVWAVVWSFVTLPGFWLILLLALIGGVMKFLNGEFAPRRPSHLRWNVHHRTMGPTARLRRRWRG